MACFARHFHTRMDRQAASVGGLGGGRLAFRPAAGGTKAMDASVERMRGLRARTRLSIWRCDRLKLAVMGCCHADQPSAEIAAAPDDLARSLDHDLRSGPDQPIALAPLAGKSARLAKQTGTLSTSDT